MPPAFERIVPATSRLYAGLVVPMPTLPFKTEIGELPTAEVPVKTGTVLVVPPEVVTVVCAAAATAIIVNPSQANTPFVIVQSLSFFIVPCARKTAFTRVSSFLA
jgi:hypothetical protein